MASGDDTADRFAALLGAARGSDRDTQPETVVIAADGVPVLARLIRPGIDRLGGRTFSGAMVQMWVGNEPQTTSGVELVRAQRDKGDGWMFSFAAGGHLNAGAVRQLAQWLDAQLPSQSP